MTKCTQSVGFNSPYDLQPFGFLFLFLSGPRNSMAFTCRLDTQRRVNFGPM